MISQRISDDIPPKMKIMNMVIPILMHFWSFVSNWSFTSLHKTAHQPTKSDVITDVKLFLTVYRRIYCHKFLMLSNQMTCYKIKCIRIHPVTLCILKDISKHIDTRSMGLSIMHFKGSQVEIHKL